MNMFADSLIVVAHPDDDILWFGSVVDKVGGILFCFNEVPSSPGTGDARLRTIADYPLGNVTSLGLDEPAVWNHGDWSQPVKDPRGITLHNPEAEVRYAEAYEKLLKLIGGRISRAKNIFTHNPWGDYGHEEHILVYHALKALQRELNFDLWFSNYCSNRSVPLMNRWISGFDNVYESLPVNLDLVHQISAIYSKHGCWTWYDDYQWFDTECLLREPPDAGEQETQLYGHSFPVNYLKLHIGSDQTRRHRMVRSLSKLRHKLRSS